MSHHYPAVASAARCIIIASARFATCFICLLVGLLTTVATYGQTLTASNGLSCSALSATLTASSSCTGAVTYRFSGPNDFTLVNTTGLASVSVDGAYSVTATSADGLCTGTASATVSSSLHPDYLPLVDLYNSTNGPGWTNNTGWLTNCDPCGGWFGVSCVGGRVTSLGLKKNLLSGSLANSIGSLSSLQVLELDTNTISGPIPAQMSRLSQLKILTINDNQLAGQIPGSLSALTGLQALELGSNSLTGPIPASLGGLTSLTTLLLNRNQLAGSIPNGLSTLVALKNLFLDRNQLTGSVPAWIVNLTQLVDLDLSHNQLTGGIPANVGNLVNLEGLALASNPLGGTIPGSLSALTKLENLDLSNNGLTGSFPTSITAMTDLVSIDISTNQLSGPLPNNFDRLGKLFIIDFSDNQFTGPLPSSLGHRPFLFALSLGRNQFTGSIPSSYGLVIIPLIFDLANNQLSGCLPRSLTNLCSTIFTTIENNPGLPNGGDLDAFCETQAGACSACALTITTQPSAPSAICARGIVTLTVSATGSGPITYQWFRNGTALSNGGNFTGVNSASLTIVDIQANNQDYYYAIVSNDCNTLISDAIGLTITQPTHPDYNALADLFYSTNGMDWTNRSGWLTSCDPCGGWFGVECLQNRVQALSMSNNRLAGTIPDSFSALSSLSGVYLAINQLTGSIPAGFGKLTNLTLIQLNNNQLSGSIPSSFSALLNLEYLSIFGNNLSGSMPASLGALTRLINIDLGYNQLSGTIPNTLGALPNLTGLYLNRNQLTGPLPSELGSLTGLTGLGLSENQLTGSIPGSFSRLVNLERLYLSNNQLSGCIPSSLTTFCGQQVDISNNPGLPNGGDWAAFCVNGAGVCSTCNVAITTQPPVSSAICARGIVTLTVSATGSQPLTYQWFRNGAAVSNSTNTSGVTSATLTMVDIQTANAGSYYVVVSSSCGSQTSTPFSLTVNPPTHADYNALADLFYSTNGMGWTNRTGWMRSCDPCGGWFGVTCTGGRVSGLSLTSNNLNGQLLNSLGTLSDLYQLVLVQNKISGTIPESLTSLTNLWYLQLIDNQITGEIPNSIGNLRNLRWLHLSSNKLSGSIPRSISALSSATSILLQDNLLTGSIPENLNSLTSITELTLRNNQLTGSLPNSLSTLITLPRTLRVDLSNNDLSGCIPNSLTNLCYSTRSINISGNPNLPNGGDWSAFCNNRFGSCSCILNFSTQPSSNSTICSRGSVRTSVSVINSQSVSYQWYKDGITLNNSPEISGVSTATLTITDAHTGNSGLYFVVVSSPCTSVTSNIFALSVNSATHPDYSALASLYHSTNGSNWINRTGWLNSCDPCSG